MSNRGNSENSIVLIFGMGFAFLALTVWKIHHETGLPFETLGQLAKNFLFMFAVFGGLRYFEIISLMRCWNWIFGAVLLALIPAFNVWGGNYGGYAGFYHFEPAWYSQTVWQLVMVVGAVSSKYLFKWSAERMGY